MGFWNYLNHLEHCFSRSQVKLHGAAPPPSENQAAETMEAVEEEIYDCIRVLYARQVNDINIQRFLEAEDEFVEDAGEDLEAQIINAYQPALTELAEPQSEPPPPARITHGVALEVLETLTLYKLQTGIMDSMQQQTFDRERRRIQGAQIAERGRQRQRTLEE